MVFFILLEKMTLEITIGSLWRQEFHPHWREPMDLMAFLASNEQGIMLGSGKTTQPHHQVGMEGPCSPSVVLHIVFAPQQK